MAIYRCDCNKQEKEIAKATIVLRDNKWVTKEAMCECGKYMTAEPVDGFPQLKRTEASLSRNKKREKLWSEAKETLTGERGINDDYK
jgi:hypothetical protein